jgi:hypothetical protein
MEGEYPRFKSSYLQEELAEAFQLGPGEFDFVCRYRGDHNRHGIAILTSKPTIDLIGLAPNR